MRFSLTNDDKINAPFSGMNSHYQYVRQRPKQHATLQTFAAKNTEIRPHNWRRPCGPGFLLKKLHLRHKEAKLALGKHSHDLGFVFIKWRNDKRSKTKIETDYIGYPECPKQVDNRMQRLLKAAEIPTRLGPHSLRHTHTSLLAEARVGLQEIMDRLGHTDDDTTKNVYLHVTKEMKKEAVEKFSALMKSI